MSVPEFSQNQQEYNQGLPVLTEAQCKFLESIKTCLEAGGNIGFALDFDNNIALSGESKGLDPRDSVMHSSIGASIARIIASRRDVVIVSARGVQDVRRLVNVDGVQIVGSLGWETLDREGESQIHERVLPYKDYITTILGEVRVKFSREQLGISDSSIPNEPNVEIPVPEGGKVILQRKGYNEDFPEGINLTWSMNMVGNDETWVELQKRYATALQTYYEEAFRKQDAGLNEAEQTELRNLCGFRTRPGFTNEGLPTFDVEIRPVTDAAKANAMVQLLRTDGEKRDYYFAGMPSHPLWIFSGDHPQDFPAMRVGNLAQRKNPAYYVYGIWSKPSDVNMPSELPRGVDVVVNGVEGNALLLNALVDICEKYPQAA